MGEVAPPVTDLALDQLDFSNRFTRHLPADPDERVVPRQVNGACFSRVRPASVSAPELVAHSREVAELLGLDAETVASRDFVEVFSGNRLPAGSDPFAMCYGGHQFGNWAGQLGDGRATAIGEIRTPSGEYQTLQLKGAGLTPYSRGADGLAVLRSSVREFLCSEAMHHLGVPTTRALSLVVTGDKVVRDVLYDGNPAPELGAIVCRVAPSFTRFGNFQIFASRGETQMLRQLVEFTIRNDFSHLVAGADADTAGVDTAGIDTAGIDTAITDAHITRWFAEVVARTARMVVEWMRVGFVHGVMNTDNMSILGLTIDYGPYGWLDDFDPGWTPNTTDAAHRRYRYGQQPQIAHWNLAQLGSAVATLVDDLAPLQEALDDFVGLYEAGSTRMMADKLGLRTVGPDDQQMIADLLGVLTLVETDMTIFFRRLADLTAERSDPIAAVHDAFYLPEQLTENERGQIDGWLRRYQDRVRAEATSDEERRAAMNAVNPKYVLRNYLAQLAIDRAESGDASMVNELLEVLRRPYDDQPEHEPWAERRPDWARSRVGCSMLSCSS